MINIDDDWLIGGVDMCENYWLLTCWSLLHMMSSTGKSQVNTNTVLQSRPVTMETQLRPCQQRPEQWRWCKWSLFKTDSPLLLTTITSSNHVIMIFINKPCVFFSVLPRTSTSTNILFSTNNLQAWSEEIPWLMHHTVTLLLSALCEPGWESYLLLGLGQGERWPAWPRWSE